jgi:hypothetical protein
LDTSQSEVVCAHTPSSIDRGASFEDREPSGRVLLWPNQAGIPAATEQPRLACCASAWFCFANREAAATSIPVWPNRFINGLWYRPARQGRRAMRRTLRGAGLSRLAAISQKPGPERRTMKPDKVRRLCHAELHSSKQPRSVEHRGLRSRLVVRSSVLSTSAGTR